MVRGGFLSPEDRADLIALAWDGDPEAKVRRPVHLLYFRVVAPDVIEIARVLHERMEPGRHAGGGSNDQD